MLQWNPQVTKIMSLQGLNENTNIMCLKIMFNEIPAKYCEQMWMIDASFFATANRMHLLTNIMVIKKVCLTFFTLVKPKKKVLSKEERKSLCC